MHEATCTTAAEGLIRDFAARTGVSTPDLAGRPGPRYLWTDAFAVFALLGLNERTGEAVYLDWASRLVRQVHEGLGRHREDDPRTGWISGLPDEEGRRHPTRGGLRIGKRLPERGASDPFDERLEWERDGQYFHYLTKWMHALNRMTLATGDPAFNAWAVELADVAHRSFRREAPDGTPYLAWKMSIDLSRPLVPSTGQLDALDGFVTIAVLQATEGATSAGSGGDLSRARADLRRMCDNATWITSDELGIGGLLTEVGHLARLTAAGQVDDPAILDTVLLDAERSLRMYSVDHRLHAQAQSRLAFRELGLSIGLRSIGQLRESIAQNPGRFARGDSLTERLDGIRRYQPLVDHIESFWLDPANRATATWEEHRDINSVMLATSLVPDACLELDPAVALEEE